MFKVFEMSDFCIRSSTLRALAPSSFLTDLSRCFRVTTQYINYYVVLFSPVTIVSLSNKRTGKERPCHMPFHKLIPPFTLTALEQISIQYGE